MRHLTLCCSALALSVGLMGAVHTPAFAQMNDEAPAVSGGVADDGLAHMEDRQHNYSLKVTYAGPHGEFLSDVAVVIRDRSGAEVLNTSTNGPILLAELAPGTYSMTSSLGGAEKTQKVTVSRKLKAYTVHLNAGDDQYEYDHSASRMDRGYGGRAHAGSRVTEYGPQDQADALNATTAGDNGYAQSETEHVDGYRHWRNPTDDGCRDMVVNNRPCQPWDQ